MKMVSYNVTQVKCLISVLQHLELPCHSILSAPRPIGKLVLHFSYLGTMLYFHHSMCKVCEDASYIVHIAKHLQVHMQTNKILLQCTVHTPKSFKLNSGVSQTI